MKEHQLGKEIIRLALPATVENIFQTLVGFVDTLLIAQLGLVAVTAVGLANAVLNVYLAVFLAIGVGGTALIARSLGAGQLEKARRYAGQVQEVSIVAGILFGLVSILFGHWLLQAMGAEATVLEEAQVFFYWVGGLAVLHASMTSLGTILRASGDTVTPMKIGLMTNIVNLGLDYLLIFGIGSWSGLGILGTALGTILARMLGAYLLFREVQKTDMAFRLAVRLFWSDYKELITLTIPAALERLVMRLGQVVYFSLILALGTTVYASHMIAGNIESFTYMPAYGLATAAAVMVGQALGQKDLKKIRQIGLLSSVYGVLVMSCLGVILFVGAPYFAGLFTGEAEAIQQVVIALRIDAFNQPGLAVSLIMAGALQGMGDTRSPLYSTMIGMWGVRVLGVILFGQLLQWGIGGIWLSILIDLLLRATFLSWRFFTRVL